MSELEAYIAQLNQHPDLAVLIAPLVTIIEQQTQRIAQLEAELAQWVSPAETDRWLSCRG